MTDSKIALDREKSNYFNLEKQIEENEKQSQIKLNNSNINNINSTSKLELDKLEQNYKKSQLDYDNLLLSDQEQINNFKTTIKSQHNNLKILTQNISLELDKLFSVSETNKNYNEQFDQYL
jgi:hypothetical protein